MPSQPDPLAAFEVAANLIEAHRAIESAMETKRGRWAQLGRWFCRYLMNSTQYGNRHLVVRAAEGGSEGGGR